MRKLKTKDVFALAKIIKKAKVKEGLKNINLQKATVDTIGMEMIMTIIEAGADTETEIYALIENISETSGLSERPFTDFIYIVKQIAKENDLMAFFKQATLSTM